MNVYIYYVIFAFIISLISGAVLIPVIIKFCRKRKLYDLPDTRKVHRMMIPRLGGIAFLPSMCLHSLCRYLCCRVFWVVWKLLSDYGHALSLLAYS